ncbi:MAG TPA: enolase C-terminal domain-like protein [Candidatus Latescibacteria bacterium]|jgi:L-alanine-DL-glutamate epimerase-like enolase superfamily enzyme|nr:enolase [Gemmatimonadaceae bacterium]MDP6018916.1 enolase C-terminal domain-like protein [Candidatus Latescibacterota bacterium]HJP32897.1 enolase C-terminal domain-like protein [Candidatus Latescibacterota bacterium]
MKVVNVERIVVDVPFTERQQQITAREVYNWAVLEICKVTSDTGHVGWGETVLHYTWGKVSDESVERVMGKSPAEVMHDDGLGSGLQMALFDLVGKILEVPVHKLLGQKVRDWTPISWWSIDASPEDWAAEAQDAVAAGYTSFKNKPRPWWDIVAQVDAISKVVPSYFKLDLDANATFQNAATAIPIIKKLEGYGNVAMFESPIPQGDLLGNRQIRQAIQRPVAMHFGSPPFITCVREEVCDGFVICAGKSGVMKQGTLAAEAQMPFWLQLVGNGLMTTWAAHLGAVLTHATWPTISCVNMFSHHLLKTPIEVVGGYQQVPDGPGLGVDVDEEAIERFRVADDQIQPFAADGKPYDRPKPRLLNTIVYPDGSCVHMASTSQGYGYFSNGHGPAQVEGAFLEVTPDDGSKHWSELFERAGKHPVRARREV